MSGKGKACRAAGAGIAMEQAIDVTKRRAFDFRAPALRFAPRPGGRVYVVKDDVVGMLARQGASVRVVLPLERTTGAQDWIAAADLAPPTPWRLATARLTPSRKRVARLLMASLAPAPIPRSLFALSVFYGGMVCIAGVLGNKQVSLGPLAVESGIFAFLLLVVTSSAVAELHGQRTATTLVRFGFVPLVASLLLTLAVLAVPASPSMAPDRVAAFELMMGGKPGHWLESGTPRIWIGGIVAYGISQTLNVSIFSWLKGREGARLLWLRSAVAGMLSQAVDSVLFVTIAFYGVFPITQLLTGQLLAKVVLSALLVPPLIYAAVALGRRLDRPHP